MKYRKKQVVVDAWVNTRENYHTGELKELELEPNISFFFDNNDNSFFAEIETLEGVMKASEGDWIIRGVRGEYYPCKDDIFKETYEEVPPEITLKEYNVVKKAIYENICSSCGVLLNKGRVCPTCGKDYKRTVNEEKI